MPCQRSLLPILCLLATLSPARGDEKTPEVNDKQFRRAALLLLEDPTAEEAPNYAKLILVFTIQTPKAAVFTGAEETQWFGKDKQRSGLLFAAYSAGNTLAQLNAGVKRNDRYSGVLYLFGVYRGLQARDKEFKIAAVEELLKLHREDKLVKHLLDLEGKKPTKLSPEDEEAIRKAREKKDKQDKKD